MHDAMLVGVVRGAGQGRHQLCGDARCYRRAIEMSG